MFSIETLRLASISITASKSCGLYGVSDSYASKLSAPLCLNASLFLLFLNSDQVKWINDIKAITKVISMNFTHVPCTDKNAVYSLKLLQ
jgi:hypothetical protein